MDMNELRQLLQLLRDQGVTEYSTPNLSLKLNVVFEQPQEPEVRMDPTGAPPEDMVRALSKLPAQYGKVMRGV
jgi:hypothetical protein